MRITSPSGSTTRIPWISSVAPLVIACVMWAVTGSPLSLLFGAMSPMMVIAHFLEQRRDDRRRDARDREAAKADHPAASNLIKLVGVARSPERHEADARQIRLGTTHDGAPFVISSGDGVVIEGPSNVAREVKRAVTAQSWWSRMSTSFGGEVITTREGRGRWLMTVAFAGEESHGGVNRVKATLCDRDAPAKFPVVIYPDTLTAHELARLRAGISEHSRRERVVAESDGGIGVTVGSTLDGDEIVIDLVRHGPHAVVSGMTGSGKTSFITAWILALAQKFSADELEVTIIDFKGGLDFGMVSGLPHCIGVATDTEPGSIDRALGALGIEMRRREEALKRGEPVSRLVVVLDEFRATAAAHPLAVPTVVDLSARGRALGVHVILSTQRAASTISEDILANVPLRIAFRALSAAESRLMVGSDIAHTSLRDPGEAVVAGVHDSILRVRMHPAITPTCLSDSTPVTGVTRQLWAPALPHQISLSQARTRPPLGDMKVGACLGVTDVPALQSWRAAWFDPHVDGHLMITGTAGSGRTTALRAVTHEYSARWVRDGVDLWDVLDTRRHARDAAHEQSPQVIVIDGLESTVGELAPEFRDVLVERLTLALRNASDCRFVISCDADGAWAMRLGGLFPHRLELVAGADIPGRARWRNYDLQVAMCGEAEHATDSQGLAVTAEQMDTRAIAVTRTPPHTRGDFLASLAETGLEVIHVASPDEWMRDPARFATLCHDHAIVISHDVSSADLRLLVRHLMPVPPVRPGGSLVFAPDGTYRRVR